MRWAVLACVFAAAAAAEDERVQKAFPVLTQTAADNKPFTVDGRIASFWFHLVMRSATEGSLVVGTLHDGCPLFVADGNRVILLDALGGSIVDYRDVGFFFVLKGRGGQFQWQFGADDSKTPARIDVDIQSLFESLNKLRVEGTEFFGTTARGGVLYAEAKGRMVLVGSPPTRSRLDYRWSRKEGKLVAIPAIEGARVVRKNAVQDLHTRMQASLAVLNALFDHQHRPSLERSLGRRLDWEAIERKHLTVTTTLRDKVGAGPVTGSLREAKKAKTPKDRLSLLEVAARNGDVEAQTLLGVYFWTQKKQHGTAIAWFKPAAEAEHGMAQAMLGSAYAATGKTNLAVKWYRRALAHGSEGAQYALGRLFERGTGVPRDLAEAERLFRLAAKQGHADAQYRLAMLINKRDPRKAADWFEAAAAQEHVDAAYRAGRAYRTGKGRERDDTQAARLYEAAARAGNRRAQAVLSTMYARGRGVKKDLVRAYAWAVLAVQNGETKLTQVRDILGKELTPAQVVEANKLIKSQRRRR